MEKTQITFCDNLMVIINDLAVDNIIFYENIVKIVCDHPYLRIFGNDGKENLIFYGLAELAKRLPTPLVLCSKSAIVNLNFVEQLKEIQKKKTVCLKTGGEILVSRSRHCEVKRLLKQKYTAGDSPNKQKACIYTFGWQEDAPVLCTCFDYAGHAENCSAKAFSSGRSENNVPFSNF
jgi:hypothetical protein